MGSGTKKHIPSLINIGSAIQKLMEATHGLTDSMDIA
jgi:hypothetical protein